MQRERDAMLLTMIENTMKKHTDNLMNVLEGVTTRLLKLENKVEDLKASLENNHGSTDGKLRQIDNTMREVQAGVQAIKDKHEILETQLQLSKVEISTNPSGPPFHHTNPFYQLDSYYQPSGQQPQRAPSSPPIELYQQSPVHDEASYLQPSSSLPSTQHPGLGVNDGSGSSLGSSSSNSGSNILIDDIAINVSGMGFSKDRAKAIVKRLINNGQTVDLNVVLDKLTTGVE